MVIYPFAAASLIGRTRPSRHQYPPLPLAVLTALGDDGAVRRYVLTVTCPDRIGIVAAVSGFIAGHGGWVVEAAQHGDLSTGRFFCRLEMIADSLPFGPDGLGERFTAV